MPRRRRSRFPLLPALMLALAGALGAIWWLAPATWTDRWGRSQQTAAADPEPSTAGARPAPAAAYDVCALVDAASLGRALGGGVPVARHVGADAAVPAAGACTWSDGPRSLTVLLYTRASRAAGGDIADGAQYFASVLTGFEYEYKDLPRMLPGIGDAAAFAGFGIDGGPPPQLAFRRGEFVVQLISRGYDAARTEAAARLLAGAL